MTKPRYGSTPLAEQRPGAFKAFCRSGAWVDVAEVLAMDPPLEGSYPERWNHTLEHSEMLVPCSFETTDRAAFDSHMLERHDRRPGWKAELDRGWDNGRTPTIKCRPAKPSREVKPLTKRTAEALRTCPSCGLVAELDDRAASVLWWDEHVRGCALAMAGAAS